MASPSVSSEAPWTYSVYVGTELKLADKPLRTACYERRVVTVANLRYVRA
jgi:hypothetical protein